MKYLIKGEEYEFDFDWTLKEAFFLKEKAFLTITEFPAALSRVDPHAVAALIYTVLRRNRQAIRWEDVIENYKFTDLEPVVDDDVEGGDVADPPTQLERPSSKPGGRSGKTPKSAT